MRAALSGLQLTAHSPDLGIKHHLLLVVLRRHLLIVVWVGRNTVEARESILNCGKRHYISGRLLLHSELCCLQILHLHLLILHKLRILVDQLLILRRLHVSNDVWNHRWMLLKTIHSVLIWTEVCYRNLLSSHHARLLRHKTVLRRRWYCRLRKLELLKRRQSSVLVELLHLQHVVPLELSFFMLFLDRALPHELLLNFQLVPVFLVHLIRGLVFYRWTLHIAVYFFVTYWFYKNFLFAKDMDRFNQILWRLQVSIMPFCAKALILNS